MHLLARCVLRYVLLRFTPRQLMKGFTRTFLLSESGGNLYRICIMILSFKKIRHHQYRVVKGSMVYPVLMGKNEIELYEWRGYNLQDPLGEKGNKGKICIIRSLLFLKIMFSLLYTHTHVPHTLTSLEEYNREKGNGGFLGCQRPGGDLLSLFLFLFFSNMLICLF